MSYNDMLKMPVSRDKITVYKKTIIKKEKEEKKKDKGFITKSQGKNYVDWLRNSPFR